MNSGPPANDPAAPIGGFSRPVLAVLLAAAVAGYLWQGVVHRVWGWSLLGLAVSAGAGFAFSRMIASGQAITTWGTFDRTKQPVAFRICAGLCLVVCLGTVVVMIMAQPF